MSTIKQIFLPGVSRVLLSAACLLGINLLSSGRLSAEVDFIRVEKFLADGDTAKALDLLTPAAGKYRLTIEARDNANGFWDDEAVMFEITGD